MKHGEETEANQTYNFLSFFSLFLCTETLFTLAKTSTVIVLETFRKRLFLFKLAAEVCDITTSEHRTVPINQ